MVDGLYALSPVNQLLPPSSARSLLSFARTWRLLRARQDHTTSPSAARSHQKLRRLEPATTKARQDRLKHRLASTMLAAASAFRPTFRDVGDTPLCSRRNGVTIAPILCYEKPNYFLRGGLTEFGGRHPTGKSGRIWAIFLDARSHP